MAVYGNRMYKALVYRDVSGSLVPQFSKEGGTDDVFIAAGKDLVAQYRYSTCSAEQLRYAVETGIDIHRVHSSAQLHVMCPYVDEESGYTLNICAHHILFTVPIKKVDNTITIVPDKEWDSVKYSVGQLVDVNDVVEDGITGWYTKNKGKTSISLGLSSSILQPGSSSVPTAAPAIHIAGTTAQSTSVQIDIEGLRREIRDVRDANLVLTNQVNTMQHTIVELKKLIANLYESTATPYDVDDIDQDSTKSRGNTSVHKSRTSKPAGDDNKATRAMASRGRNDDDLF